MKAVETEDHSKARSYFTRGYVKGYQDAIIGLTMKLLQSSIRLSSSYLQEWEKGYIQGYREGLNALNQETET